METTTKYLTLTLALLGTFLAIAEDIKNIPFLAEYSNYATAVVGAAIAAKQVLLIIQKHLGKE
jgi:hypothetical protein